MWGQVYRTFNLVEGCCWIGFAGLVFWRWLKNQKSSLEAWYALTFLVFGLTDYREAYLQTAPLVLTKGVLIVLLFWQRNLVTKRWYPHAWY